METRQFEFCEGTSDKFWAITLDGASHTVRYGRRGTAGQEQTKEFTSVDAARKSYDKLIDEKVRKGYQEKGAAAVVPPAVAATKAPAKPAAAKKAPVPEPPIASKPERVAPSATLHLAPEDWLFATWRPRTILTRPAAKEFSLEDGLRRFARVFTGPYGWSLNWDRALLSPAMTEPEARFWLHVMLQCNKTSVDYSAKGGEKEKDAAQKANLKVTPPLADVIKGFSGVHSAAVLLPLSQLYPWPEVVCFVAEVKPQSPVKYSTRSHDPDSVFRTLVLPYLSEEQLDSLRPVVSARLNTDSVLIYYLAPLVGAGEALRQAATKQALSATQILGLDSEAAVVDEMKKFTFGNNVRFQPLDLRGWLANTELRELDFVADAVLGPYGKNRDVAKEFAKLVTAPEAARPMLRILEEGQIAEAKDWFDRNPEIGLQGLEAHEWGRDKLGQAAQTMMTSLRRRLGLAVQAGPVVAVVDKLPDGLEQAFAFLRKQKWKAPKWITAGELPALQLAEGRLPDAEVNLLLAVLATAPSQPPHPITLAMKCYVRRESLDSFAEALFTEWLRGSMPSKEKWALLAMGALGSDRCALKLAPYIREWPGEAKHQAAVTGIACLRLIGTDTALMQISLIAQKAKFAGIKKEAQEAMEAIAADRGLTRDELEDRIVPDCGLDAQGSRLFDFGPRQFRLRIGPALKPVVVEGEGNRRDDLPKPGAKDDAVKAAAAVSEWKLLKKQVSDVVKVQVARLEQGLVTQRRWRRADFEALMLGHPVLGQLVRRSLWGTYNADGLMASFRIAEDGTYADVEDNTATLPADGLIGLVHPAQLADAARGAWGEVFADYEIVQPFPQLARTVRRLTPEELKGKEIKRHTDVSLEPVVMAGILKRLSYMTGPVQDGGSYTDHVKWFSYSGLTAILQHTWMSIGYYDTDPVQIEQVYFVREKYGRGNWFGESVEKVPLSEVGEEVISEILGDLGVLAAKAKEK